MKFAPEHYEILKNRISDLTKLYDLKKMKFEYAINARSERRFYWDIFWKLNVTIGDGIGMSSNCGIVGDYNDDHIFTAVKKATIEVMGE
jgi:hypothetical protein